MRRLIWSTGAVCGIVMMTLGIAAVIDPSWITAQLPKEGAILLGLFGLFAGLLVAAIGTTKAVRPNPRF